MQVDGAVRSPNLQTAKIAGKLLQTTVTLQSLNALHKHAKRSLKLWSRPQDLIPAEDSDAAD